MTEHRKICKRCRGQVRIIDDKLVLFYCKQHGTLRWHQITHGDPA